MSFRNFTLGYGIAFAAIVAIPFAPPSLLRPNAPLPPAPADSASRTSFYDQPAEKAFKNIVIFKGKTAGQVLDAMRFMNAALGVTCDYCHSHEDFSKDDKPEKATARGMYYMTEKINNQEFSAPEITCYTCHGGRRHPLRTPLLSDEGKGSWRDGGSVHPMPAGASLDQVLGAYVQALGGTAAVEKVKARRLVGTRAQSEGPSSKLEIVETAAGNTMVTTVTDGGKQDRSQQAIDGASAWQRMNDGPTRDVRGEDLARLLRMGEIIPASRIKSQIPDLSMWGRDTVNGRIFFVVGGTGTDGTRERFYFDASTGLLARRYIEYRTILGPVPFSAEYDDYRPEGGVMTAHTIRWQTPQRNWTDTFTTVESPASVPATTFGRPADPPAKK